MLFFLPTGSDNAHARRPWVTITIGLLCIGSFVWTSVIADPPSALLMEVQGVTRPYLEEHPYLEDETLEVPPGTDLAGEKRELLRLLQLDLERFGGPERKLALVPARGLAQLGWITNLFVHFDFFHIAGNLLFLWIVGPLLEEAWGRRRFALFYLLFGLFASAVQYALESGSIIAIGGASGAIAGCMGAFTVRFAITRIRFHYFLWFIRIFAGSIFVPAWICGLLWFGNELWNLKTGEAAGVATGAHVGGFFLGAIVALAIKALGFDRSMLTVAESEEERARREGWYAEATASLRQGDFDGARAALRSLTAEVPNHPGAAVLFAEVDLRAGAGHARLEKLLRGMLEKNDPDVDDVVRRLWPSIDPRALSPEIAWKLAERLGRMRPAVEREIVDGLVDAVAAGTGSLALKARARQAAAPPREERVASIDPSALGSELELGNARRQEEPEIDPAALGNDVALQPAPAAPRVLEASVVSVSPNGLEVVVNGTKRLVPWAQFSAVHAAVVPNGAGKALVVDLVVKSRAPTALRLRGSDPAVAALYPGQPVPSAWQGFLGGVRGAVGLPPSSTAWTEVASLDALTARWAA